MMQRFGWLVLGLVLATPFLADAGWRHHRHRGSCACSGACYGPACSGSTCSGYGAYGYAPYYGGYQPACSGCSGYYGAGYAPAYGPEVGWLAGPPQSCACSGPALGYSGYQPPYTAAPFGHVNGPAVVPGYYAPVPLGQAYIPPAPPADVVW